jgi:hypothetical protein
MDFDEWMTTGIKEGFCGPPVCALHDAIPMTPEEEESFFDGGEPCVHVIRPYESSEHKATVEENHSPSTWRDTWTKP